MQLLHTYTFCSFVLVHFCSLPCALKKPHHPCSYLFPLPSHLYPLFYNLSIHVAPSTAWNLFTSLILSSPLYFTHLEIVVFWATCWSHLYRYHKKSTWVHAGKWLVLGRAFSHEQTFEAWCYPWTYEILSYHPAHTSIELACWKVMMMARAKTVCWGLYFENLSGNKLWLDKTM